MNKNNKDMALVTEPLSITILIEKFRECKTAAEEREFINKERSIIRNNIRNWSPTHKSEAILKLIWINMLGHETEFAQVECMNALFIENFKLKVMAYLGLTIFLSEKSEVLMMATNRIRIDLEDPENDFVVALALRTFSEIADRNMTVDLFPNIQRLLNSGSKYIRKKAVIACIKILKKHPELVDQFENRLSVLLEDRNQGLMLCSLQLAGEIIRIKPAYKDVFRKNINVLYSMLKGMQSDNSYNYSINGVNDPFLQCEILAFAQELVTGAPDLASDFGSNILMVFNGLSYNKTPTAKCLLYQCARSIMSIESTYALKKMGVTILGDFLDAQSLNHQYTALRMLLYISSKFKDEVKRYDRTIQKYARDADFSIQKIAVQILTNVTDKSNVEETFGILIELIRRDKRKELFIVAMDLLKKNALSLLWFEEKVLLLLKAFDTNMDSKQLTNFYDILSSHPSLQLALVYRCATTPKIDRHACWVIGELYGKFTRIIGGKKGSSHEDSGGGH